MQSGKIVKIHAPYDFKVSESLEFYDARNGRILPKHTLTDWTDYVRIVEKGLSPALIRYSIRDSKRIVNKIQEEEV